ncbi:MAG: hypothetical protein A4E45_01801 [Methanosaeta sp. PtaB.Bin039]|nr:MAG: hypothetical protein A4E45_01801 [Methanosaeta sp. PtaB.Bin039]
MVSVSEYGRNLDCRTDYVRVGYARSHVTDVPAVESTGVLLPDGLALGVPVQRHIHCHASGRDHYVAAVDELLCDIVGLLCPVGIVAAPDQCDHTGYSSHDDRHSDSPDLGVGCGSSSSPHHELLVLDVLAVGELVHLEDRHVTRAGLLAPSASYADLVGRAERLEVSFCRLLDDFSQGDVRRTDERALHALGACGSPLVELFLGEHHLLFDSLAFGLDRHGCLDPDLTGLDRVEHDYAGNAEVDQVVDDSVNRIVRPVPQTHHDLVGCGDDRYAPFLAVLDGVAPYALLVDHDRVHHVCPDHLSPPSDGTGNLGLWSQVLWQDGLVSGLGDPRQVMSCAANATDIDLVPQVVVLDEYHRLGAGSQVVAVGDQDSLVLVERPHPNLDKRRVLVAPRHVVGHDLEQVGYLHAQVVEHSGVKSLGLEVGVMAFLAGVGRCEKVGDVLLDVRYALAEVLEGLWFLAHHRLVDR